MNAYNSFAEFVASFPPDTIWRYWIIKKKFTPYEEKVSSADTSIYEDVEATYAAIDSVTTLPDGDILIGFYEPQAKKKYVTYYKLSEIDLARAESDMEE